MIDLKDTIEQIEKLLLAGTARDLTYAALECRLAIERICYDRLRMAHAYIPRKELASWQPRQVVNFIAQTADELAAATATFSISRMPICDRSEQTEDDFANQVWTEVGTQVGFDPRTLGRLWNALANVALHLRLPEDGQDYVGQYGASGAIRPKVEEALAELRNISGSTLSITGTLGTISFVCVCGFPNKRTGSLLSDKQVVSCASPKCYESYVFHLAETSFERRIIEVPCHECGVSQSVPWVPVHRTKPGEVFHWTCICGQEIGLAWRLFKVRRNDAPSLTRDA
ncbi:hypothetical protein [Hyphomicrobium sp. D-2]|uniref:hypothetical protein n=1 Tax=Hyphomicrobium sp. D-2 TaxID=3041621 RepID=UPI002456D7F6|nr:hypothetical protein [Hyphomicrobium sp. D-2]MDH4982789.1 hypothetical protein [Hyphomicrobium sp. D-2]